MFRNKDELEHAVPIAKTMFKGWVVVMAVAIPFLTYLVWEVGRSDRFIECIHAKHMPSECSKNTKP